VELPPALGPVARHRLAAHAHDYAAHLGLALRERRQLAGCPVERVLDEPVPIDLLDAARREVQQRREYLLGRG